jgi:hypothetical protein
LCCFKGGDGGRKTRPIGGRTRKKESKEEMTEGIEGTRQRLPLWCLGREKMKERLERRNGGRHRKEASNDFERVYSVGYIRRKRTGKLRLLKRKEEDRNREKQ